MKEIFIFSLAFLLSIPAITQSGKHELGVNASPLIRQLLRAEPFPKDSDHNLLVAYGPYMLAYRVFGKQTNFRAGAGFLIWNNPDTDFFTLEDKKQIHLNLRMGFEKTRYLSPRWLLAYGLDAILHYKKQYQEDFFGQIYPSEIKTAYGAGPFLGIQFYFVKNLSLSTESSVYFTGFRQQTENLIFSDNGNIIIMKNKSNGIQSRFNLPLSIFLHYRF